MLQIKMTRREVLGSREQWLWLIIISSVEHLTLNLTYVKRTSWSKKWKNNQLMGWVSSKKEITTINLELITKKVISLPDSRLKRATTTRTHLWSVLISRPCSKASRFCTFRCSIATVRRLNRTWKTAVEIRRSIWSPIHRSRNLRSLDRFSRLSTICTREI